MRQEQIIELLVESGLIKPNSIHTNSILPEFYTFAKLVEQATLERAARVCEDADNVEASGGQTYYAQLGDAGATRYAVADEIRDLKTQGE